MTGLLAPRHEDGNVVTGNTKKLLRIENKRRRIERQEHQARQSHWAWQKGKFSIPTPKQGPIKFKGGMCPAGLALHHPAADLLTQYASGGCPVQTGRPWSRAEMQAAIKKGPHASALEPAAMLQLSSEAAEKEAKGQCKIVLWDDIKNNPPTQLKISPLAAVAH